MGRNFKRNYSRKTQKMPTKVQNNTPINTYNTAKSPTSGGMSSPGVASTIGQGISLGAGAAIGNAAVTGLMGGFSNNQNPSDSQNAITNKNSDLDYKCDKIINSFNECIQSNNYNCHLYLETFKECFNNNRM